MALELNFNTENMITIPNGIRKDGMSFSNIILKAVDHLLWGYIRGDQPYFPIELKQFISLHFIGGFLSKFVFNNEFIKLFSSNCFFSKNYQEQLLHITMKLLCPGDNSDDHHRLLKRFIDITFNISGVKDVNRFKSFNTVHRLNSGLLSEYSQICDFYSILGNHYNHTILSFLCVSGSDVDTDTLLTKQGFAISLLQNKSYYLLYSKMLNHRNSYLKNALCVIPSDIFRIQQLRTFLAPLVLSDDMTFEYIDTFDCLSVLFAIFQSISENAEYSHDEKNIKYKVQWLWLEKEIKQQISYQNTEYVKTNVLSMDLLLNIVLTYLIHNNMQMHSIFTKIALNVLSLIQKRATKVTYSITEWNGFEELISELLRTNTKHGTLGFTLLEMEINKWKESKNKYSHLDALLSYADNKAGLFKLNIVRCLRVLKGTYDGDIANAEAQLQKATEVCYDINEIARSTANELKKFSKFYKKMNATKLIKPVIRRLKGSTL